MVLSLIKVLLAANFIRHTISYIINRQSTSNINLYSTQRLIDETVLDYKYEPESAEDAALHQLFLEQIALEIEIPRRELRLTRPQRPMSSGAKKVETRNVIEEPTVLEQGVPLEIVYKKKLTFGNFVGYKDESNSIIVRLPSKEEVSVDVGQIISVWDCLADESPSTPEDWAAVAADAFAILGNMSPRKSDLEEFWSSLSQRRTELAVDSLDLGIYIFQEYNFRRWLDPYATSGGGEVQALSAAQRHAAALLLFFDDFHFKRRPSVPISGAGARGSLTEGGYKILEESVVIFKQCDIFLQHHETHLSDASATSSSTKSAHKSPYHISNVHRLQRALETYAVSPSALPPPPAVKHLLKRSKAPVSPTGAKNLLLGIKGSSTSGQATSVSRGDNSAPTRPVELNAWGEGVMDAAQQLVIAATQRRQELLVEPVGKIGKAGRSGRMDFRGGNDAHPVICLDSKRASFFDDGFSLSPATGEVLVHIADVSETLRRFPALVEEAKERVSSTFTPQGPLHMLPPVVRIISLLIYIM